MNHYGKPHATGLFGLAKCQKGKIEGKTTVLYNAWYTLRSNGTKNENVDTVGVEDDGIFLYSKSSEVILVLCCRINFNY